MEDAILGNSKGATYKSFILDVEIVIKKEGTANVAEGRVTNKSTKGSNEDRQDTRRSDMSKRNQKQDVYQSSTGQTYLNDKNNQPKHDDLLPEKSKISNTKSVLFTHHQNEVSSENRETNLNSSKQEQRKPFLSNETNHSDTSSEKHQKKKRPRKTSHSARVSKGKVEPVDFLECNRIFMCNYLQLPRHNSDSALYCNYLGTLNKILQQEYIDNLDKTLKNARSVGEIFSLLKPTSDIWTETSNNKLCLSTKDLGNIYSCGDCNVAHNFEMYREKFQTLYGIKNFSKTGFEAPKLTDSPTMSAKSYKPHRISKTDNVKIASNESNKEVPMTTIITDVVEMTITKNIHSKKKTLAMFQRIRRIKRSMSFLKPINLIRRQFFK